MSHWFAKVFIISRCVDTLAATFRITMKLFVLCIFCLFACVSTKNKKLEDVLEALVKDLEKALGGIVQPMQKNDQQQAVNQTAVKPPANGMQQTVFRSLVRSLTDEAQQKLSETVVQPLTNVGPQNLNQTSVQPQKNGTQQTATQSPTKGEQQAVVKPPLDVGQNNLNQTAVETLASEAQQRLDEAVEQPLTNGSLTNGTEETLDRTLAQPPTKYEVIKLRTKDDNEKPPNGTLAQANDQGEIGDEGGNVGSPQNNDNLADEKLVVFKQTKKEQETLNKKVDDCLKSENVQLPFGRRFPHQQVKNYRLFVAITNSSRINPKFHRIGNVDRTGLNKIRFKVAVDPLEFKYRYRATKNGDDMEMKGTVTGQIAGLVYLVDAKFLDLHVRTPALLHLQKKGRITLNFVHADYISKKFLKDLDAAVTQAINIAATRKSLRL